MNSVVWPAVSRSTEIVHPGQGHFSSTGATGAPQPDNMEFISTGDPNKIEHCLAVLNDRFNDGQKLHDLGCDQRLSFVCKSLNLEEMESAMQIMSSLKEWNPA